MSSGILQSSAEPPDLGKMPIAQKVSVESKIVTCLEKVGQDRKTRRLYRRAGKGRIAADPGKAAVELLHIAANTRKVGVDLEKATEPKYSRI